MSAVAEAVLASTASCQVTTRLTALSLAWIVAETVTPRVTTAATALSPRTGAVSSARTAANSVTAPSAAPSPLLRPTAMVEVAVGTLLLTLAPLLLLFPGTTVVTPLLLPVTGVERMSVPVLKRLLVTGLTRPPLPLSGRCPCRPPTSTVGTVETADQDHTKERQLMTITIRG